MSGRRMSTTRRLRIFAARHGVCGLCEGAIDGTRERWDVHHRIPLALTGDDSDANLEPVHASCHERQTRERDIPAIAKAKRVAAKHRGAHRPRSTLAGSKVTPFKRTIDGRTLRRDDQ